MQNKLFVACYLQEIYKNIFGFLLAGYDPLQNIWLKVKKSSKFESDFKNLLYNFACFFTVIVKD